ncbi:EF-hand calcium-binding domain-containing protein 8 [Seriola lalandi dorsalis]|uniref:EF-hand calcium-binding domain-containing protein 8 n=1 Tax=Seriola lalandi dorsalis TaxID=1841481 RepID=UPI000C6F5DD8|nr:EF-hand calcium-binding domain-containing protein 8 [Seriola lalandi dorsalis]
MEKETINVPEERTQPVSRDKMFSAEDIPEIVRVFREADADGSGGLDMEEFRVAIEQFYGSVNKEDLEVLHMQIDANGDKNVDIGELLNFLMDRKTASERLDFKNQPFPKPFKIIPVDNQRAIVRVLFRSFENGRNPGSGSLSGQIRTYQKGQYLSVSSNGVFTVWTDSFNISYEIPLYKTQKTIRFAHNKKMHVTDMVYIKELKEVAVSTTDRELLFYYCDEFPDRFRVRHSLIVEDMMVNAMNYWSNGKRSIFSFGDTKGSLYLFVSKDIERTGLFNKQAYEDISLQTYRTVYLSTLLRTAPDYYTSSIRISVFNDMISQIQYFPSIDSFGICGSSSRTMALIALPMLIQPEKNKKNVNAVKLFKSRGDQDFFTCVEYSPSAERLVTGGTDGLLRVWFPHKNTCCERVLSGHMKPINHIMFNDEDKLLVSLSEDMNVRVWSEDGWMCRQSFQVLGMGHAPISSMCYNVQNNELVLANSAIGKCLGRGTDVFTKLLTSHDKPVCSALYHSIFKQVVSVCQNGVVTVWDVLSGQATMQFKVTLDQHVGLTAISFDESQRRLITISQDGKVRLWNFNSGTELAVLPVTVPRQVTGIVCINNRVFVAGRKSKTIFDLDMEEHDHRFLEHDHLDDITSLDVHENTLITASSNGNIIIWDADTAEVLYRVNASENPRTIMADKHALGRTGTVAVDKFPKFLTDTNIPLHKKSIPQTRVKTTGSTSPLIKCLRTRVITFSTATLLTSTDGYIYAWSVISKGGLLGKFRAVKDEGAVVTTMSTDVSEQILLTGDSTGRIYLWDIQGFGFKKQTDKGPFENIKGWLVSVCPPPLLGSWKAHLTGVVSVVCDPTCNHIITAGLDNNVRLWTNTGCYKGLFGGDRWDVPKLSPDDADQEQEDRTRSEETLIIPLPFLESPPSSSSPTPDYKDLFERIEKATAPPPVPLNTPAEISAEIASIRRQLRKVLVEIDEDIEAVNRRSKFDLEESNEDKQEPGDTKTHECLPPISEEAQLTQNQTQSKPHSRQTLLVRRRINLEKSSPPYLTWTKSKCGRPLLTCGVLPPCPQNILHPIYDAAQEKQLRPQPPQTPPTTGSTEAMKNSPHTQGSANTVKQESVNRRKHVRLPPISEKVQLTHGRTQDKTQPPQTPPTTGSTKTTKI